MNLNLTRPLAMFDLETTGISIAYDRIVEISIVKANPDNSTEVFTKRVNPIIQISEEARSIHGISNEDVENEPSFKKIAPDVIAFMGNADLGGFNVIRFDIPLLMEEFLRSDVDFNLKGRKIVDVQNIFHKMEPRNLTAAYKFYCDKDLTNAHSAEADAVATMEILKSQIEYYKDTPYKTAEEDIIYPVANNIEDLSEFSYNTKNADLAGQIIFNEKEQEVFNFGKHKGKPVEEIFRQEPQYYDWMMKSQFPLYTKKIITSIYLRKFNKE
ncbi:MAG: 3'-5' exonuclease [Bacteroidales bacterium]|nr:3'-5' exonuclease [Bacteroidales bacterium]